MPNYRSALFWMQQVPQSRVYKKQLNINNTANNKKVQKPLASWMFRESILLDDRNKNAAKYLKHSLNILIQLWIYLPNLNALSANLAKWSNTLKQFVGNLPTNYLSVFDYFEGLTLSVFRFQFLNAHFTNALCWLRYNQRDLSFL